MVIELLRFRMSPEKIPTFLAKNAELWTPALQARDGFVDKEIWTSRQTPGEVLIMIHWASMEQWKSFPSDLQKELDSQMGDMQFVDCECFEYDVAASTIHPVVSGS
jgi:uncharacterized protein (TIGR03792 family)